MPLYSFSAKTFLLSVYAWKFIHSHYDKLVKCGTFIRLRVLVYICIMQGLTDPRPSRCAFQHVQYLSRFALPLVRRHFPCAINTVGQKNTAKLGSAPVLVYVLLTIVLFMSFALICFLYLALSRQ